MAATSCSVWPRAYSATATIAASSAAGSVAVVSTVIGAVVVPMVPVVPVVPPSIVTLPPSSSPHAPTPSATPKPISPLASTAAHARPDIQYLRIRVP